MCLHLIKLCFWSFILFFCLENFLSSSLSLLLLVGFWPQIKQSPFPVLVESSCVEMNPIIQPSLSSRLSLKSFHCVNCLFLLLFQWLPVVEGVSKPVIALKQRISVSTEMQVDCKRDPQAAAFKVFSSVQFSLSVVSDSLRPYELQHARPPCPSELLEFTQTHVHRVGDAIQPSHPLSSPSPPAPKPSQNQSLFQ